MARYYRPSNVASVDYAFRAPVGVFSRAIDKVDRGIDSSLSSLDKLKEAIDTRKAASKSQLGQGMYLPEDEQKYIEEVNSLESGINDVTNKILENPLEYGSQTHSINKLRREVGSSLTNGPLYWFNKNYNDVKSWLDENKKKSKDVLNAVYENALSQWGGTIGSDGEFKSIKSYLPSTVYDSDIHKEALSLASKTDKQAPSRTRRNLILENLANNSDVINTEYQKLNTGLYKDDKNEIIDPNKLSDKEKNELVRKRLISAADKAARLTQDYTIGSKSRARKGEQPATSINSTKNILEMPNLNPLSVATHYLKESGEKPTLDNMISTIQKLEEVYTEAGSETKDPITKLSYNIKNQILKNQTKSLSEDLDINHNLQSRTLSPRLDAQKDYMFQTTLSKFVAPREVAMTDGWNDYNLTVDEKKSIEKNLKENYTNLGNIKDKVVYSDDPALNGKTIADLQKNVFQRKIINERDATEEAAKLKNTNVDYSRVVPEKKDGKFLFHAYSTDTDGNEIDLGYVKEGNQEINIPIKESNSYTNFKVDKFTPAITSNVDENGNPYIKIPVVFNGDSKNIYVKSDPSVTKLLGREGIIKNQAKRIVDELIAGKSPIQINDSIHFDYSQNTPILKVGQREVKNRKEMEKVLHLYFDTIYNNRRTKK